MGAPTRGAAGERLTRRSLEVSVRRRLLDRDLAAVAASLCGHVLEVGGGRAGRRGEWRPPEQGIESWTFLDVDAARGPHVQADIVRLPFAAARFDSVMCLEVLEYVWSAAAALAECARVLRPGGTLIVSTPFTHRVDAADDYWRFGEPSLRRLLGEAGFDVRRVYAQGYALASAVNVLRFVVSRPGFTRRAIGRLLNPVFERMLVVDERLAQRDPELAKFTTGYLVVAVRT